MSAYKDTIFLPKTAFPMKGDLAKREPGLVDYWKTIDLYKKLRKKEGAKKFILHSGPPYANGHFHIGHAFNLILKDMVTKSYQMMGYDAPLVPGWDCHGLPIEWKIEEKYQKQKIAKESVPILEFRAECRAFASHWIGIQREETRRVGVIADFDHPYVTMDYKAEASITKELFKFLHNGGLVRGFKPVMWSVVEKTALADAEVEYHDRKSPAIYVAFPLVKSALKDVDGAKVVIWTTTPWSIPGNRAVAYGPDIDYVLVETQEWDEGSATKGVHKLIVAKVLLEQFARSIHLTGYKVLNTFKGESLKDSIAAHPLKGEGYDFDVPLYPGEHVTTDAGTGLVHTAPGHGLEDFELCKIHGIEVPATVDEAGVFYETVPVFAGEHVFKVNPHVIERIASHDLLLGQSELLHSYPHSWRSKSPLIYRATPQWFISMDVNHLRAASLSGIDQVTWYPKQSRNRIYSMVEQAPDWCISRQRAWGVPIAIFINKKNGDVLKDPKVEERILKAIEAEGSDVWFNDDAPQRFLAPDYNPEDYTAVQDILDVWFDAGSTQAFVLEDRAELGFPADLYVEGSDQHRGWFQKSLFLGCAHRDTPPFKAVLTHGFVVDGQGRKMSKSLNNGVSPEDICNKLGAEILRLWVAGCDYTDDLRIGNEILKHQEDVYRRYRNTLRYLLGALCDYDPALEMISYEALPDLEKWVLHRLYLLDEEHKRSISALDFQSFYTQLHAFCATELSAFYFDIRKDSLYCDGVEAPSRRSARYVLDQIFNCLTHWLAPLLSFTAEEAWRSRYPEDESIHLRTFPTIPDAWRNDAIESTFEVIRKQRRVVTGALEEARAKGVIGSSLQAHVVLYDPNNALKSGVDYAELSIVSSLNISEQAIPDSAFQMDEMPGLGVLVSVAEGAKCERCWKVLEEVVTSSSEDLCVRCDGVVKHTLKESKHEA
ncbi:MAG: isoleucine--tRNA ligase [Candidatus Nucleicultricaceae bacterium]